MTNKKENEDAIDEILRALDKIPEEITSKILVDDIAEALIDKLRKKISL